MNESIRKLNLAGLAAALIFFFLPWIDLQCANRNFITQTGLQTIYGGGTVSKEIREMGGKDGPQGNIEAKKESTGTAYFVALALAAVLGGLYLAIKDFRSAAPEPNPQVGGLAAAALALVLLQLIVGFPIRQRLLESIEKSEEFKKPAGETLPGLDQAAAELSKTLVSNIQTKTLSGLYLELIALAIPAGLFLNGYLDRLRRAKAPPPPVV